MSDLIKSACPFCGSRDIRFTGYPGMHQNSHCECKDCHTIGPAVFVDDEKAATEAWNRRTQPEATDLSAAILRLQKADAAFKAQTKLPAMAEAIEFQAASKALIAAALASSANALSAGDRVDAETPASIVSNHEFMRALEAYTDTFPRAGKEALIDLRKTSDYGLIAAIDAAILQSQKSK